MNRSSILAATLACAEAITVQIDAHDIIDDIVDFGEDLIDPNTYEDLWYDTGDLIVSTGETLVNPNFYSDLWYDFSDFTVSTAEALIDPQTYVDIGNDIADFGVDSWDWMSDGDNWEAAGKTIGYGSLALITGNPEGAWDLWTNDDLYYGDTWDEIDDMKE